MNRYELAIVGPGALGLLFASRLARHFAIAMVARDEGRARELRAGVSVAGQRFAPQAFPAGAPPAADWVLVLVKANDTRAAAEAAARMAPLGVLSLQNGWVEDLLRAPLLPARAAQGVTTEAAHRRGAEVIHAAAGETLAPPGFEPLVDALVRAGFEARTEPAIRQFRLRKLLVSACLNPLTALHRVPNGMLLEAPYIAQLRALAEEAAAVLEAEGLRLGSRPPLEVVADVVRATASNRSSMLQDVEAGRPTEAEHITGALLRMAAARGLDAPGHRALLERLRAAAG